MAFSSAANSGYAPGSIAARPVRQIGGRKRPDSAPMGMAAAAQGPTRADNIAASRADGTFDAKRNAYNAANKGSYMDAAGNIGPKAEMPATPTPAPSASTPAPAAVAPVAPVAPATASATMKPRGPASFEGKPKTDFFGAAMSKYGPTAGVSVYKDPQVQATAANGGKPLPAPKSSPAPAAKPASMVAAATPAKPYSGPMARPAGQAAPKAPTAATAKPSMVAAATPPSQPTQPKAETRQTASLPTANHASPKAPSEPSLEELRKKAEAAKAARQPGITKVAKTFVSAAQAVDKGVPAAVSRVTSGIKNTGDSIVSAIDRGMAPARRWLYGSNQETPEEKAYREAMAKRQPAPAQPAAKKQTPTFRTPYLPNRRTSFSMN